MSSTRAANGDHPRVCGEKVKSHSFSTSFLGSPPRVRGEVEQAKNTLKAAWITPACAGRRQNFYLFFQLCKDHPRVCGEKFR